jgi:hypothetical protein
MAEKLKEDALGQVTQTAPKLTEEIIGEFQKLTDPKARKAFFEAHPELAQLYSPVNFHVA